MKMSWTYNLTKYDLFGGVRRKLFISNVCLRRADDLCPLRASGRISGTQSMSGATTTMSGPRSIVKLVNGSLQ